MRNTLTLLFAVLTLGMSAQCDITKTVTILFMTDGQPMENSYQLRNAATDELLFAQFPIYPDSVNAATFQTVGGHYKITTTDSGCDGVSAAGLIIVFDAMILVYPIPDCGNECTFIVPPSQCECEPVAPSCPTDFDQDGQTSVSDLLIFIAEYGTICD